MSAKHTPGPWKASGGGRVWKDGRLILSAWHPQPMPDANEERNPGESWLDAHRRLDPERARIEAEMDSNARLIAAAPDLLAALQHLTTVLRAAGLGTAHADAAIAKATGATP